MSDIFRLHRSSATLLDAHGRRFDARDRRWTVDTSSIAASADVETLDAIGAVTWLQRESGVPVRVPVGVIGPRDATERQLAVAMDVGERLAQCGVAVLCGGRHGVMQAVCEGVARNGGISIGLIGDTDPALANPFARVVIATGIGEARNALIARSALCLIAIGDSYGTLSEVALGLHFGKLVLGLEGAACVEGVVHVETPHAALMGVARLVLAVD